jgi:hypothetical protein
MKTIKTFGLAFADISIDMDTIRENNIQEHCLFKSPIYLQLAFNIEVPSIYMHECDALLYLL